MNNPAFTYMMRNYAERVRNESEAEHKARIERQKRDDACIEKLMAKLCGTENMYDEDGDVRF